MPKPQSMKSLHANCSAYRLLLSLAVILYSIYLFVTFFEILPNLSLTYSFGSSQQEVGREMSLLPFTTEPNESAIESFPLDHSALKPKEYEEYEEYDSQSVPSIESPAIKPLIKPKESAIDSVKENSYFLELLSESDKLSSIKNIQFDKFIHAGAFYKSGFVSIVQEGDESEIQEGVEGEVQTECF
jgi:hypothetical protein